MTLLDRENARLVGIGLYTTDADARNAEAVMSAGIYEVIQRD